MSGAKSIARWCTLALVVCTSGARAEDQQPIAYPDRAHLRIDYALGGSGGGVRGEIGASLAWSVLAVGFSAGGATALWSGNTTDMTGMLGLGFDLGDTLRLELMGELGTRSVLVGGGLLGGPDYSYESAHAGARLVLHWRVGARNDAVHARIGFVVFYRADLAAPSLYSISYETCWRSVSDPDPECTQETMTGRRGGGDDGGVLLRLALDLPL